MLVIILSVHVIKIAYSISIAVFCYIDGDVIPILFFDPVHDLPYPKRSDIEPIRRRSVMSKVAIKTSARANEQIRNLRVPVRIGVVGHVFVFKVTWSPDVARFGVHQP